MSVELTDFLERPYRIPHQEESTDLQAFVTAKSEELLRGVLGTTLYNSYVAGIAAGSPAQKWVDLRDGKDYTYAGITYRFSGLDNLLVPGIFALWVKETNETYTVSGVVKSSPAQNATAVSATRKITESWGKFLDLVGSECEYRNTLYGFLIANESDYGTLEDWTTPGSMNAFDL